jgi:hypothetical protein
MLCLCALTLAQLHRSISCIDRVGSFLYSKAHLVDVSLTLLQAFVNVLAGAHPAHGVQRHQDTHLMCVFTTMTLS